MKPHDKMNCLDFRRARLADPYRMSPAAREHAAGCAGCQAFTQRAERHEEQYARALAVPVPEGLEERVIIAVRSRQRTAWQPWALAASLVLGLGLSVAVLHSGNTPGEALPVLVSTGAPMQAIEHVLLEPEALRASTEVPPEEFQTVLAAFGARLMAPVGKVVLLKRCPGPEGEGWHLVVDTPQGRVTLLLFPGSAVQAPMMARHNGMEAITEPGGRGYYSVVSTNEKAAEQFTRVLRENVRWRI